MSASEFDLIEDIFRRQAGSADDVIRGIGDDAALVTPPPGELLAVSVDTLVCGVHFPVDTPAADVGYKSLAVNLSDMAAMGARPLWATLALTLPDADIPWLSEFARGWFEMARSHDVTLIGGDLTAGPLTISVQILGAVPPGQALQRGQASPGDDIHVTGRLGDAALALAMWQDGNTVRDNIPADCLDRLLRPEPRVITGIALRGIANAAIDLSDGLAGDLNHLLGGKGARIDLTSLPLSPALHALSPADRYRLALQAGDDYELCFTSPPSLRETISSIAACTGCPITRIGEVQGEPGIVWLDETGAACDIGDTGYRHFSA